MLVDCYFLPKSSAYSCKCQVAKGPLINNVRKYWIFDPLLFSCGSHRPDPPSKLRSHPSPSSCNFSFDKQKAIVTLKSRRQNEIILWNTADYYVSICPKFLTISNVNILRVKSPLPHLHIHSHLVTPLCANDIYEGPLTVENYIHTVENCRDFSSTNDVFIYMC